MKRCRGAFALAIAVVAIGVLAPATASAAITSVLAGKTVSGAGIPCTAQADGTRVCFGT